MERFCKSLAPLILGAVFLLVGGCAQGMPVDPDKAQIAAETTAELLFAGEYETIAASALPDSGITVEALEEAAAYKVFDKGGIRGFRDVYCEAVSENGIPCTRVTLVVKCDSGQLVIRISFTEDLELALLQMD